MLRCVFLLSLFLVCIGSGFGQAGVDLATAQRELADGDFAHAADLMDSLETRGEVNADFYLSLGNARFESGAPGRAILAYERGLRLRPGNKDLANNLRFVREQTGLGVAAVPDFFLLRWWRIAGAALGTTFSYVLSLLFWWIAVAGCVWWILRRAGMEEKQRFTLLPAAAVAVCVAAAFFVLGQSRYTYLHQADEAVLVAPAATLRVSPTQAGSVEAELEQGYKLRIIDEVNGYVKVQLADGRQGYLLRSEIEVI